MNQRMTIMMTTNDEKYEHHDHLDDEQNHHDYHIDDNDHQDLSTDDSWSTRTMKWPRGRDHVKSTSSQNLQCDDKCLIKKVLNQIKSIYTN